MLYAETIKSRNANLSPSYFCHYIASKIAISSPTHPQADNHFTGTPLTSFPPITHDEAQNIIRCSTSKSSTTDFIPTSLIKTFSSVFTEIITILANLSIDQGIFSSSFKLAQVTLLLKKAGLDKSLP